MKKFFKNLLKTNKHTNLIRLPIKSDLISRGQQCHPNNVEIDSPQSHGFFDKHNKIITTIMIIITITVILMVINSDVIKR